MSEKTTNPETKEYNKKLILAFFLVVIIIFTGIFILSKIENWTNVDSVYFTIMTLTIIGFVGIVLKTVADKLIMSVYALIGVATFLFCIGIIAEHYFFRRFKNIIQILIIK